jgi:hypothetical protein
MPADHPKKEGSSVGSFTEVTNSYLEDKSWQYEIDEFADKSSATMQW